MHMDDIFTVLVLIVEHKGRCYCFGDVSIFKFSRKQSHLTLCCTINIKTFYQQFG